MPVLGGGIERDGFAVRLSVERHAGLPVARGVPLDPLPLDVRRARESGIAARTCGHVFPLTFFLLVSIGRNS